jgi:hypothetical protein
MSKTVYVATNGNDNNPGTIDQPFRNIITAIRSIPPGEGGNVLIRGGTYDIRRPIPISNSEGGNPNSRLVISNYNNEKVILDGSSLAARKEDVIKITSAQYVDIKGLEIFGSYVGIGILGDSQNIQILNNIVHDTDFTGIAAFGTQNRQLQNIRVDGNTVYRTNLFNKDRPIEQPSGWGMGITFSRTEGGSITNNISYENYGEGIGLTLANGAVVSNNVAYDNFSVQMYMDNATNSVFENNFIYNTGNTDFYRFYRDQPNPQPAAGILLANETYEDTNPIRGNIIRNNIVLGGASVIGYGGFDRGGGLKDTQIVNNTFYGNSQSRVVLDIDADNHENSFIFNNIFYSDGAVSLSEVPSINGLNFNTNLWFGGDPGLAQRSNDINANPLFFETGGFKIEDYRLQSNSPAIGQAVSLGSVPRDFLGNPRGATPTIGAKEFNPAIQPEIAAPLRADSFSTDFNRDNAEDVIAQNIQTGETALLQLSENGIKSAALVSSPIDRSWQLRGLADLNGDRMADALWQNSQTGEVGGWLIQDGVIQTAQFLGPTDRNWQIEGMGDFNGDGKGDIFWRNPQTSGVAFWTMDGLALSEAQFATPVGSGWQAIELADFDGDRKTDIFWYRPQSGEVAVWRMDGAGYKEAKFLPKVSPSGYWQVAGISDFTLDGTADVLWHDQGNRQIVLWEINGASVQSSSNVFQLPDKNWEIIGVDDFVGGAEADIFLRNTVNGTTGLWQMSGSTIQRAEFISPVADRAWRVAATKDIGGDGKADIIWQNSSNGSTASWQFNGDRNGERFGLNAQFYPTTNLNNQVRGYF